MKRKFVFAHMKAARMYGDLSTCKRRKVGAMLVKANTPIAIGYNGTPPGEDNCCETIDYQTKPDVIHAEDNTFRKLEANGIFTTPEEVRGAALFVTACPCPMCLPMALDRGVRTFFFADDYRVMDHIIPHLPTLKGVLMNGRHRMALFYRVNTFSETIMSLQIDALDRLEEIVCDQEEILIL